MDYWENHFLAENWAGGLNCYYSIFSTFIYFSQQIFITLSFVSQRSNNLENKKNSSKAEVAKVTFLYCFFHVKSNPICDVASYYIIYFQLTIQAKWCGGECWGWRWQFKTRKAFFFFCVPASKDTLKLVFTTTHLKNSYLHENLIKRRIYRSSTL